MRIRTTIFLTAVVAGAFLFATFEASAQPHHRPGDRHVELLDNGYVLTVTSDDADEVEQIQQFAQRREQRASMTEEERAQMRGERQQLREQRRERVESLRESVTVTTSRDEDVLTVTMVSDDEESVEFLQRERQRRGHPDVTREQINIENGVRLVFESDNTEALDHIATRFENRQHHRAGREEGQRHRRQGRSRHRRGQVEGANREVEYLDNGVRVTVTSDDAEVVDELHEKAERMQSCSGR
jgi:TusA-related sulfurtransferase